MSSTPTHGNKAQIGRRHSIGQKFKSPLGQLFKSPLSSSLTTPVKETPDSLKDEIDSVKRKIADVEKEITLLTKEGYQEEELKIHIEKLHEYNEIKDTGQMVIGRIADMEGVRTKDLYPRYGLQLED